MPAAVTHLLGPDQGQVVRLLALGVRFMIDGERTGGAFSLVEHPLPPRALGAPLHTHHNEDEYSYVLEGRFGVQLGNQVLEAGPGDLLFKPRGVAHAFWNAGDEPARLLELISPAGFENYFREMAPLLAAPERDQAAIGEVVARYQLEIDFTTIPHPGRTAQPPFGLTATLPPSRTDAFQELSRHFLGSFQETPASND